MNTELDHRLTNALAEIVREESLGKWLQTPNEAFGGLKPIEVIDRGGDRSHLGDGLFLAVGGGGLMRPPKDSRSA